MGSLTFSTAEKAPADLMERRQQDGKFAELTKFLEEHAEVGKWVKVDIEEENADALKKAIHSMQTSIRFWRNLQEKRGKAIIKLSQYRKVLSNTKAQVWIKIDRFDRKTDS